MTWDGNIQIPRSMIYHPLLDFPYTGYLAAWIWMLSEARPTSGSVLARGRVIHLERGQLCHPVRFMALCCDMSINEFRRFLALLKIEGLIKTHLDGGRLITTICDYHEYQQSDSPIGSVANRWKHGADERRDRMQAYREAASQSFPPSAAGLEKARKDLAARRQAPPVAIHKEDGE